MTRGKREFEYKIAVPGKLMLAGEYAILDGRPCLAATVSSELVASFKRTPNLQGWHLTSDLWTKDYNFQNTKELLNVDAKENIAIETLQYSCKRFCLKTGGLSIHLDSGLDPNHGLGSSSALRLALLLGMKVFSQSGTKFEASGCNDWQIAREAFLLQRESQSLASGYDVATQMNGGLNRMEFDFASVDLDQWPGRLTKLTNCQSLNRFVFPMVGGRGAPTSTMTAKTKAYLSERKLNQSLTKQSDKLVEAFSNYINYSDQNEFSESLEHLVSEASAHRKLFEQAPGFPTEVYSRVRCLDGFDSRWTFKTTGAGGEDALIFIGLEPHLEAAFQLMEQMNWFRGKFIFKDQNPRSFVIGDQM